MREGTHRWQQAYGWEGPLFSHFFKTDEAKRELMGDARFRAHQFAARRRSIRPQPVPPHSSISDLRDGPSRHRRLPAVSRICEAWSSTCRMRRDWLRKFVGASAVTDRIEIIAGDFFAEPLPDGDVYALGRILHDWTADKILTLLNRISREAAVERGAVLIAEKLLLDDKSGPRWAQMQNLNMLDLHGRERANLGVSTKRC